MERLRRAVSFQTRGAAPHVEIQRNFNALPEVFSALCIKRTNNLAAFRAHVNHLCAMQDKTINSALLALRHQMIRGDDNGRGLDYVEALLQMRGVDIPRVLPAKRKDVARKGHMTVLVLEALRDGPKTAREVAAYIAHRRPELSPEAAHKRTSLALCKAKRKGLVRLDGMVWLFATFTKQIR